MPLSPFRQIHTSTPPCQHVPWSQASKTAQLHGQPGHMPLGTHHQPCQLCIHVLLCILYVLLLLYVVCICIYYVYIEDIEDIEAQAHVSSRLSRQCGREAIPVVHSLQWILAPFILVTS